MPGSYGAQLYLLNECIHVKDTTGRGKGRESRFRQHFKTFYQNCSKYSFIKLAFNHINISIVSIYVEHLDL